MIEIQGRQKGRSTPAHCQCTFVRSLLMDCETSEKLVPLPPDVLSCMDNFIQVVNRELCMKGVLRGGG